MPKKNQKRLDDLNALRLSASLERKIVNMVPTAIFHGQSHEVHLSAKLELARALARLFKRSLPC